MQKRRTYIVLLVIVHCFSDVIPVTSNAMGRRLQKQETKRGDWSAHYRPSGSLERWSNRADNEITPGDDNDDSGDSGDRSAVVEELDDVLEGRQPGGGVDEYPTGMETGKEQGFGATPTLHLSSPRPEGRATAARDLKRLLRLMLLLPAQQRLPSSSSAETRQFHRQVDPLLSCVEAYCSKSDWNEEEYLGCISSYCSAAVDISGKRSLTMAGPDRASTTGEDGRVRQTGLRGTPRLLGVFWRNSNPAPRPLAGEVDGVPYEIGLEEDRKRAARGHPGMEERPSPNAEFPYVAGSADGGVYKEREGNGEDAPHFGIQRKIKRWLRHAALQHVRVMRQQRQQQQQQQQRQQSTPAVANDPPMKGNSLRLLLDGEASPSEPKNSGQSQDSNVGPGSAGFPLLPVAKRSPKRLAKRGFNDVYNTCIQSNCARGGRGLVYYSCIQHHCG